MLCRHYLEAARRYRPHLLSEPEERILSDKSLTAASAWVRLFSELTSAITVDLGAETGSVSLEEALSRLQSPDREVRRAAADAVTAALARACAHEPSCSTRCSSTSRSTTACGTTTAGSPAGTSATRRATSRSRRWSPRCRRYDIPQRWYALKARLLGIDKLADYDRMASVASADEVFGWSEARELVLDAYVVLARARHRRAPLLRRGVDRRARAPGQATGRALRVHGAEPAPVPAAQLDVAPP